MSLIRRNSLSSFISSYSIIRGYSISRNGAEIFNSESTSVDEMLNAAYDHLQLNYPKYYKMDKLARLGVLASELVLQDRALKNEYKPEEIAVVLSNKSSSLDTDLKYFESTKKIPSPALFVYTLPNIVAGEICIRQGFKGENGFFVFDAFDPDFMTNYVNQVLQSGAKACLAGWVEVLGEQHNVFLYLVENNKGGLAVPHTKENLIELYR